ncbi:MAG: phosphatase PAP2 family protein [Actinomycetota bacterium]
MAYILAFYGVYSFIRNEGVAADSSREALRNAAEVIRIERRLGTYHEEAVQQAFLGWDGFIRFWNIFYGTAHFVVTVVALVYLFRRVSARYPLWRNTLAFTTGLALIGFAFYPLAPPRLLPPDHGFVDTLKVFGGLWSFDSGPVAKVSNQYAAMPSLHFAWSSWCAFVLVPALRRRWAKGLMLTYPLLTLFAIVVTANHYWLDAAGGALILALGFGLAYVFTRALAERGLQPVPAPAGGEPPVPAPLAEAPEVAGEPEAPEVAGEPEAPDVAAEPEAPAGGDLED